jgi:hypothetical protein
MLAPNAQRPGKVALVETQSADRWLRFTAARLPRTLLHQRKVKNPHRLSGPPMFCGSPMLTPASRKMDAIGRYDPPVHWTIGFADKSFN